MMSVEKEYKFLIDKEIYDYLINKAKWDKKITQINYYYIDKEEKMLEDGISLRIRKIGDDKFLQFKKHINNEMLRISEETEYSISTIPQKFDKDTIKKFFNVQYDDVILVGSLLTERYIMTSKACTLCLDKNIFLEKEDYEIEIEINNDLGDESFDFIKIFMQNIFKNNSYGKFSRFYNRYRELKNGYS